MELIILLAANALLGLVNLVLTIINVFNINRTTYDLINQMIDVEMNELSEELRDYFKGDF